MKVLLKAYSQEAETILQQAEFWYLRSEQIKRSYIMRESDNELSLFIDDKYLSVRDSAATFRRRLSIALRDYKISNLVNLLHEAGKAEEARRVECMRLIILGRDEKAKKSYPDEYAELKGKSLDPIKAAAVEVLTKEIKERLQEVGAIARVLPRADFHDEYAKLKEEIRCLKAKLNELRGFSPNKAVTL